MDRVQQQIQGRLEGDLIQLDRHRHVLTDALLGQGRLIDVEVDRVLSVQIVEDSPQGGIHGADTRRFTQLALDAPLKIGRTVLPTHAEVELSDRNGTKELDAAARLSTNFQRFNLSTELHYQRQFLPTGDRLAPQTTIDVIGSGHLGPVRLRGETIDLSRVPLDDAGVYGEIQAADTVGVFQIESRAQMSMLPRLAPYTFYDLVVEVAIVRPGPIQGDMVHPYLRRRDGLEQVDYPTPELRRVLQKTLGVPLFQEQAMKIAMVAAGFSAEEADKLRRAMAAWRRSGVIEQFHRKIVEGMVGNGYAREYAEQCFLQIKGFGEYGFHESHAASFALLVYVSAWLKRYHPADFAAAVVSGSVSSAVTALRCFSVRLSAILSVLLFAYRLVRVSVLMRPAHQ